MKKPGVVLFPVPFAGHLVSMIELAKQFRRHNNSLSITILLIQSGFPYNAGESVSKHVEAAAASGLDMEVIKFPSMEPPKEVEGLARMLLFVEQHKPLVKDALASISTSTTISAFILDMFCITMTNIAAELSVPGYVFYTTGAAGVAYRLYLPTLDRMYEQDFKDLKEMIRIPGWSSPLPSQSLPDGILSKKHPLYQLVMDDARLYPQLKGVLANTFAELEPTAMKALADGICVPDGRSPPVYPVGPLLALDSESSSEHECTKWLDQQPVSSVVFLCFGSLGAFGEDQLREMARGLELSGHRFLWSVRLKPSGEVGNLCFQPPDVDLNEVLPVGFIERTKNHGLVWAKWVPQVAILSHPAVGGFVSHCGWNSTLESVCFGVPTIAWPLYAEQRMNAVLLVNDLGLSIGLRETHDYNSMVRGEELESAIRRLMEGKDGKRARENMSRMKELGRKATQEGGSSYSTLASLVAQWTDDALKEDNVC